MTKSVEQILQQEQFTQNEIVQLLKSSGKDEKILFTKSAEIKQKYIGKNVYFRGLVEFSNICKKDCLYCGIRSGNQNVNRYDIADAQILKAAKFAYENKYGSLVLQAGERSDKVFIERISHLLKNIKKLSNDELGITISLGEQSKDTYQKWFDC